MPNSISSNSYRELSNAIHHPNSANSNSKERKKLHKKNKNIIAKDALYEQGFDDSCRPTYNSKKNWRKYNPNHLIIFHESRRLKHFTSILDDSNGLEIDSYFEPKLNLILEEISKNKIEYNCNPDEPYIINFQCPKDHGDKGKECKHWRRDYYQL